MNISISITFDTTHESDSTSFCFHSQTYSSQRSSMHYLTPVKLSCLATSTARLRVEACAGVLLAPNRHDQQPWPGSSRSRMPRTRQRHSVKHGH